MTGSEPTVAELAGRAKRGDTAAFDQLVVRTLPRVTALARLISSDRSEADDVIQDAYVRAWLGLGGLREPARFEAWLRASVVRLAIDRGRARSRMRRVVAAAAIPPPGDADQLARIEVADELDRAFAVLSVEHRATLVLRFHLGMSADEIAAATGVNASTARSRLHYGLAAMRAAVEAERREPAKEVQPWVA